MEEKVAVLKELQEIDLLLQTLNGSCQKLEGELDQSRAERDRIQEIVDDLADEMSQLDGARRELAQSIQHEDAIIQRSEGRLPNIKTQKEYVAVLKEIDTAKATMRELKAKMAELDGQFNALADDRSGKEAEMAAIQKVLDERGAAIDEELSSLRTDQQGKLGQREDLLGRLPRAVASRYRALCGRRGGMAVVEARQGTCSGCNMQLPPQLYNSLFMSTDIQSCPHCSRLLYVLTDQA